MKSKEELKSLFENGDIPKQEEFWEWQDSYWHKDEKLPTDNTGLYKIKGSVADKAALDALTEMTEGDVYNLLDTGANYVYVLDLNNTGVAGWDDLFGSVDLSSINLQTVLDNGSEANDGDSESAFVLDIVNRIFRSYHNSPTGGTAIYQTRDSMALGASDQLEGNTELTITPDRLVLNSDGVNGVFEVNTTTGINSVYDYSATAQDLDFVQKKYVDLKNNYTVNEEAIGTWIDGSAIFRKVINIIDTSESVSIDMGFKTPVLIREQLIYDYEDSGVHLSLSGKVQNGHTGEWGVFDNFFNIENPHGTLLTNVYAILEYVKPLE